MPFICYDMFSLNQKKLELNSCPYCKTQLTKHEAEPSSASQVFQDAAGKPAVTTTVVECPTCAWWAVRELREDHEQYHPPVAAFMIMDASQKSDDVGVQKQSPTWKQVLIDASFWNKPVVIPSRDAVELFGTAQMLLPNFSGSSSGNLTDKLRSMAPILFPLIVIFLFWAFS